MKLKNENLNEAETPQLNIADVIGSTSRFNYDANTTIEATEYILSRAKQLLRLEYKLENIKDFHWGVSAYFSKNEEVFQSLYILEQYRGKGFYKNNISNKILTSKECGIEDYLLNNKIPHICVSLTPFIEYQIISDFYKDMKANRSGVFLMNHIDEGLYILEKIGASDTAKKAYCLHPILQSDEALNKNYELLSNVNSQVLISCVEYRSVANEYLSKRKIKSIDEIRLSPLKDVNDMLIADKIQNKKDFELYHKGTHHRSNELDEYFNNWMIKLNISNEFYSECFQYCR
jgi:hypothetical protein